MTIYGRVLAYEFYIIFVNFKVINLVFIIFTISKLHVIVVLRCSYVLKYYLYMCLNFVITSSMRIKKYYDKKNRTLHHGVLSLDITDVNKK